MKKAMVAVFAYAALSVCAEIVERPDADTLWIENGKALSVADKPGILTWQKKINWHLHHWIMAFSWRGTAVPAFIFLSPKNFRGSASMWFPRNELERGIMLSRSIQILTSAFAVSSAVFRVEFTAFRWRRLRN